MKKQLLTLIIGILSLSLSAQYTVGTFSFSNNAGIPGNGLRNAWTNSFNWKQWDGASWITVSNSPTSSDDVIINVDNILSVAPSVSSMGANNRLVIDADVACKSFSLTGTAVNKGIRFANGRLLNIYGHFNLSGPSKFAIEGVNSLSAPTQGSVAFRGTSAIPFIINTNNNNLSVFRVNIYGNYQLIGDYTQSPIDATSQPTGLFFNSGSFITNGARVSVHGISDFIQSISGSRILDISNSTINVSCFNMYGANLSVVSNTNTNIYVSDTLFASTSVVFGNSITGGGPLNRAEWDNFAIASIINTQVGVLSFYHNKAIAFLPALERKTYKLYNNSATNTFAMLKLETNFNIDLVNNYNQSIVTSSLQAVDACMIAFRLGTTTSFSVDKIIVPGTCDKVVHFTVLHSDAYQFSALYRSNARARINVTQNNTIDYSIWQGINNIGSGTVIANNSFDFGKNSGLFSISNSATPRTLAWCGSSDNNWNNSANWKLASGGGCGVCVPTPIDSVIFDPSHLSGVSSKTTTINDNAYCAGVTFNFPTTIPLTINGVGSFFNSKGLWIGYNAGVANTSLKGTDFSNFEGHLHMRSSGQSNIIATQNVTITPTGVKSNRMFFYGGGTWTFKDDFDAYRTTMDVTWGRIKFGKTNVRYATIEWSDEAGGNAIIDLDTCSLKIDSWSDPNFGGILNITSRYGRMFVRGGKSTLVLDRKYNITYGNNTCNFFGRLDTANQISINLWNVELNNSLANFARPLLINSTNSPNSIFIHKLKIQDEVSLRNSNNSGVIPTDYFIEVDTIDISAGYPLKIANGSTPNNAGLKINQAIITNSLCTFPFGIIKNETEGIPGKIYVPTDFGTSKLLIENITVNNAGGTLTALNTVLTGTTNGWVSVPAAGSKFYWNGEGSDTKWSNPRNWNLGVLPHPGVSDDAIYNLGNCIPSPLDSVFFSDHAFPTANYSVTLDNPSNSAKTITWDISTVPDNSIVWTAESGAQINIYGSLILNKKPVTKYFTRTNFYGSGALNVIKSSGRIFAGPIVIKTNGSYALQDSLCINSNVYGNSAYSNMSVLVLEEGILNTNRNNINVGLFHSYITTNRTLNITGSRIILTNSTVNDVLPASPYGFNGPWTFNTTNGILLSDSSHIFMPNNGSGLNKTYGAGAMITGGTNPATYNRVTFYGSSGMGFLYSRADNLFRYKRVEFLSGSRILGDNQIDTLLYSPMTINELEEGKTQNIDSLRAVSNNCQNLTIRSYQPGVYTYMCDIGSTKRLSSTFADIIDVKSDACAGYGSPNQSYNGSANNSPGWQTNVTTLAFGFPSSTYTLNCKDGPANLSSSSFFAGPTSTYSWSTGATSPNITVNQNGSYSLSVTYKPGCVFTDAVTVNYINAMSGDYTVTPVRCNGNTNGEIAFQLTNDVAANHTYGYIWNTGLNNDTIKNISIGIYTITVIDSTASSTLCRYTNTVQVTEPSVLLSNAVLSSSIACYGASTGAATSAPTGGNGSYVYNWTDGITTYTTQNISNIPSGNYSLTVIDSKTCSVTNILAINQPASAVSISSSNTSSVACFGASTGSLSLTATGGTPAYTYSWTGNSSTTNSATSLAAGNYTATVRDANLCTTTQTFTIVQPASAVSIASSNTSSVACFGASTGSLSLTATGGTPAYTYSWTGSASTTNSATNLAAGNYTATVRDANLCATTQTFTIVQPASAVSIASSNTSSVACFGASTGSLSLTATGGTPVYTYSWTGSASTTNSATSLAAGNYTATVRDANLCATTQTFTITQSASAVSIASSNTSSVACFGASTGSLSLTATGGTPAYTYSWTGSSSTTNSATSLAAGNYTATIRDANLCVVTRTFSIAQPASAVSIASTITSSAVCFGSSTGSATVNATGGTPVYTYSWTGSSSTSNSATSLAAGNYTATVIDANLCTTTQTFVITEPTQLNTSITATTQANCGLSNGSATITATGGSPAYTYSWTPPAPAPSFTTTVAETNTLAAGITQVLTTDANGCVTPLFITITNPNAPVITPTQTNVLCYGNATGIAEASITNGTAPYTYSWSPSVGSSTNTASSLTSGNYILSVVDAANCTAGYVFNITQPAAPLTVAAVTTQSVLCYGASSASATVDLTGGTGAYTYTWLPTGGNNTASTGLTAQEYTVTIMDANNCGLTQTVSITQPTAALSVSAITTQSVLCFGASTGSASLTVNGGTSAYTYTWLPTGGNNTTATGLTAQEYTVNILDANNCALTQTLSITEPTAALAASITNTTQAGCGLANGEATLTTTGGTPVYTYSWTNASNTTYTTSSNTTNSLSAGSNNVTLTDANGCITNTTVLITNPNSPTVVAIASDVSCYGASTGSITTNVSGGSFYSYVWNTGAQTDGLINVPAGTYTVTVTDNNNCLATQTATITQPANALTLQFVNLTNVTCFGASTGSVSVLATGGTPGYTYNWQPLGISGTDLFNAPAGSYTLLATDSKGCVVDSVISISGVSSALNAVLANSVQPICKQDNGSITIFVTGGTPVYNYTWNTGTSIDSTLSNVVAGNYTVIVSDANGCKDTLSVLLDCKYDLLIPEIFSPNGDGKNDKFEIAAISSYPNTSLQIFNRWGSLVYSKDKYNNEWDGKPNTGDAIGNALLPAGTYFVVLDFGDNATETYKGYVMLEY